MLGSIDEFKKAPSNRGLRPCARGRLRYRRAIQKSPIKSGIKTSPIFAQSPISAIQKSPIKSGIKTVPRNAMQGRVEFKKAPSNRGLRHNQSCYIRGLFLIQKSPIKSGIKTLYSVCNTVLFQFNSKKPHQIGD